MPNRTPFGGAKKELCRVNLCAGKNRTACGTHGSRLRLLPCVLVVFGALLTGCKTVAKVPTPKGTPMPTEIPVVLIDGKQPAKAAGTGTTPEPAQPSPEETTPEPTNTPDPYSKTTGRLLTDGKVYQPVLVVIGNAPQTRPQTGLMQADIIYEFSLDRTDNQTRFVALYSDQYPLQVGPVQDSRCYFSDLQREWDGMFVFDGYPDAKGYPAFEEGNVTIPAVYSQDTKHFFLQDRTVSSLPENTLFCHLDEMTSALYGKYSPSATNGRFAFTTSIRYAYGKAIEKVGLPFMGSDKAKIEFVYNGDDNRLYRYERNSKDALVACKTLTIREDGTIVSEPVSVQNLIVQYVRYTNLTDTYRGAVLTGTGKCDYFINGQYIAGSWKRESLSEPTQYLLKDGSELILEPGSTWIAMHTGLKDIKIRYAAD